MLATTRGKEFALEELRKRREESAKVKDVDNSSFPAGAPMYFRCKTCGTYMSVPESYISKPSLCAECQALKELGWME